MALLRMIRLDAEQRMSAGQQPTLWAVFRLLVTSPGALSCFLVRVAASLRERHRGTARLVSMLNAMLTGAEVAITAEIGARLRIEHPSGIVIGQGASVGDGCTIYQGVTLGRRRLDIDDAADYPRVGADVTLCANCSVLGPVSVGDGALVGAHTLVLSDVPPGVVVVGAPARVVGEHPTGLAAGSASGSGYLPPT